MKVLFYELNEVSWQVVDYFLYYRPYSTLGKILKNAHQLTTYTKDEGELHPWSTWPTLHRGVYNTEHKIHFLNQEIHSGHKPLWDILASHGISCGIFGSLHTWPVSKDLNFRFYVPDTFAQTAETFPKKITLFQKFNLKYTEKEGGVAAKNLSISQKELKEVYDLYRAGLSLKTLAQLGLHVFKEYLNPVFKTVRPIYQAPIAFDFYFQILQETMPQFSTFFTNHVASMMHRYWKHAFPEELRYTLKGDTDSFKSRNILRAMKIADDQLFHLKEFADRHDYVLMILSSMGQEAIDRGDYAGELHLTYIDHFLKMLGYKHDHSIKSNLAMHPDFAFSFSSSEALNYFKTLLADVTIDGKKPLFTLKESGLTLNCNLQASPDLIRQGHVYKNNIPVSFEDAGLTVEDKDQGTGYHQPRGVWITYHKDLKPDPYRREVESVAVAPTVLSLFNVDRPSYMKSPVKSLSEAVKKR